MAIPTGRRLENALHLALCLVTAVSIAGDVGAAGWEDAKTLWAVWETDPAGIELLLPPPLEPFEQPLVVAFIGDYAMTPLGMPYTMAALAIVCTYDGEVGTYCVGMPENEDMPVFAGREMSGFPKKMATVELERDGDRVRGFAERRGIRIFEMDAAVSGAADFGEHEDLMKLLIPDPLSFDAMTFLVKAVMPPHDCAPLLLRQVTEMRSTEAVRCDTKVTVRESPFDAAWGMLPVRRMIGSMYTRGNNMMLPSKPVATLDMKEYAPFMFIKWDAPRAMFLRFVQPGD
jgi:acetoacetate decarboxylase